MSLFPGIGLPRPRLKPSRRDLQLSAGKGAATVPRMAIEFLWRGEATSRELNELHAEAFETEVFSDDDVAVDDACSSATASAGSWPATTARSSGS